MQELIGMDAALLFSEVSTQIIIHSISINTSTPIPKSKI